MKALQVSDLRPGNTLNNGCTIFDAHIRDLFKSHTVLAYTGHGPQPYVVWTVYQVDVGGFEAHTGHYFASLFEASSYFESQTGNENSPGSKPYVDQLIYNRLTELSREDELSEVDQVELDELKADYPLIADSVAEAAYCYHHDC